MKKIVTIVIPIHLPEPPELEKIALTQILKVFSQHPITFQAKAKLDTRWYEEFCKGKAEVKFERFNWEGFQQYSELMIDPVFYERFRSYQFVLICHMDSFPFRDELMHWCNIGHDYIGCVIYNTYWNDHPKTSTKMFGLVKPEYYTNGGFGLRRVEAFHHLVSKFPMRIRAYLAYLSFRKHYPQDDIFLSQLTPSLRYFKHAPKADAEKFGAAVENWDIHNLPFTNKEVNSLPFGVHGWFNWHPEFWKPCLQAYGYNFNTR